MSTTSARPNAQSARSRSKRIVTSRCAAKRRTRDVRLKRSRSFRSKRPTLNVQHPMLNSEERRPEHKMQRISQRYAMAQTILLVVFAAVVFWCPRNYLFISANGVIVGDVLCVVGVAVII